MIDLAAVDSVQFISPFGQDANFTAEDVPTGYVPPKKKSLMYEPVAPGSVGKYEALSFLEQHSLDIVSYLQSKAEGTYNIRHLTKQFTEFANENPIDAFEIIYDYIVPNDVKIEWVKEYLFSAPRIVNIIGERGSGKNVTTYQLFEWSKECGLRPYIVGVNQKHHPDVQITSDLFEPGPGSIISIDELAIFYNSRTRGDTETEDTSSFAVARHHLKWIVSAVQVSSTGDVNFLKFCDMLIMKRMSLFSTSLERDAITELVPSYFVPNDQQTAFFMCPKFRCTVKLELPEMWDEEYSVPFTVLDKDKKDDYIAELFLSGTRPDMIVKTLKARAVRCTESDVYDVLLQRGIITEDERKKKGKR